MKEAFPRWVPRNEIILTNGPRPIIGVYRSNSVNRMQAKLFNCSCDLEITIFIVLQ